MKGCRRGRKKGIKEKCGNIKRYRKLLKMECLKRNRKRLLEKRDQLLPLLQLKVIQSLSLLTRHQLPKNKKQSLKSKHLNLLQPRLKLIKKKKRSMWSQNTQNLIKHLKKLMLIRTVELNTMITQHLKYPKLSINSNNSMPLLIMMKVQMKNQNHKLKNKIQMKEKKTQMKNQMKMTEKMLMKGQKMVMKNQKVAMKRMIRNENLESSLISFLEVKATLYIAFI